MSASYSVRSRCLQKLFYTDVENVKLFTKACRIGEKDFESGSFVLVAGLEALSPYLEEVASSDLPGEAAAPPRDGLEAMSDAELCAKLNEAFGYEKYVLRETPLSLIVRKEHPYLPDAEEESFVAALRDSLR